jgi:hypothetical protein
MIRANLKTSDNSKCYTCNNNITFQEIKEYLRDRLKKPFNIDSIIHSKSNDNANDITDYELKLVRDIENPKIKEQELLEKQMLLHANESEEEKKERLECEKQLTQVMEEKQRDSSKYFDEYQMLTTKICPYTDCGANVSRFYEHACHHIKPTMCKCKRDWCFKCENIQPNCTCRIRSSMCSEGVEKLTRENIDEFIDMTIYPFDIRCGCPICPYCKPNSPCSECHRDCSVCSGLLNPGPQFEVNPKTGSVIKPYIPFNGYEKSTTLNTTIHFLKLNNYIRAKSELDKKRFISSIHFHKLLHIFLDNTETVMFLLEYIKDRRTGLVKRQKDLVLYYSLKHKYYDTFIYLLTHNIGDLNIIKKVYIKLPQYYINRLLYSIDIYNVNITSMINILNLFLKNNEPEISLYYNSILPNEKSNKLLRYYLKSTYEPLYLKIINILIDYNYLLIYSDLDKLIYTMYNDILNNTIINMVNFNITFDHLMSYYESDIENICKRLTPFENKENGKIKWNLFGLTHNNNDLPAVIYSDTFKIDFKRGMKEWYKLGRKHRDDDKPAVVSQTNYREWWYNGKLSRINDLPPIVDSKDTQIWGYYDKEQNFIKHRSGDKPAIIRKNGHMEWYNKGKLIKSEN